MAQDSRPDVEHSILLPPAAAARLRSLFRARELAELEARRYLEGVLAAFGEELSSGPWTFDDEAGTLTLDRAD